MVYLSSQQCDSRGDQQSGAGCESEGTGISKQTDLHQYDLPRRRTVEFDRIVLYPHRITRNQHFLEAHLQELTQKNKVAEISEAKVKELLERSREFIRTHNVAECRNFIDAYVKEVVVYNDKVEVFFKINVPDEASGAIVPLQSEESTQELHNKYKSVAKGWKRTELGTKRVEDEEQK